MNLKNMKVGQSIVAGVKKYYVGHIKGKTPPADKEVILTDDPSETKWGNKYFALVGPFKTKRGADFFQKYANNNPHLQTVNDAERLAVKEAS